MMTLKEIYEIKEALARNNDLASLQAILNSEGVNAQVTGDRTIRIECLNDYQMMIEAIDNSIPRWAECSVPIPVSLVYNLFPLNKEMCLMHL